MAWKWQFRSVRSRQIFWFVMVAMVPVFVVVGILYYQRSTVIKRREFEKLQTIRDLKVRELNSWIDERLGDLKFMAGEQEMRRLEGALTTPRDSWTLKDRRTISSARALLQRLVDSYRAYHEVFIVEARSSEVLVSNIKDREGRFKKDYPYYLEVMRTKRIYISNIYASRTERKPAMTFSAPVFCDEHRGRHLFAVVVARIDLEHSLHPILEEHTGYGKTGETLIVNKDGVALGHLRFENNEPLRLKISAKAAQLAARGETGITEATDYRGEAVLAAYTHIPRTGWGFVAKRDLAESYAPIRAMVRDMAVMLLTSAVLVFFVALFLGRIVARPIVAIADIAGRIRDGDLSARCELEGADEVADLASSINDMAGTVESQITVQGAATDIANTTVAASSVEEFGRALLEKLMLRTGSQIGAFYRLSQNGRMFELLTSVGLRADAVSAFDVESREGEFGEALSSRSIRYLRNIPTETEYTYKAVAGTAMPREIVTVPLVVGRQTMAVLSLATLDHYTEDQRQIVEQAWIGLCTALSNLMASAESQRMAGALQSANEELQAKNEELLTQAAELQEQTQELEVQRRQVQEADRLKSEFLSNMSHELRTPLNSVLALSQIMISRGTGKDPGEENEFLQVIERNGRQLLRLINDILDLSKIESGRMDLLVTPFESRRVVQRTLETIRPLAADKGLTLEVDTDAAPDLETDEEKLSQILLNLLSNAVKFTPQGTVALGVTATTERAVFTVRDTGVGIGSADLPFIFDEFRQVDGSVTRRHEGTGLGLAICQKLARLLGGRIQVESSPGAGSSFALEVPLRLPTDAASMDRVRPSTNLNLGLLRPRTAVRSADGDKPPLVLVVEDNEIAALQIRTVLEESGFTVTVAASGKAALEALTEAVPAGIVLDLMMPGVDGFEVLESLRRTPRTAVLPVLVLTAKELTVEDRARLSHNNIHQLIQKGSLNRDQLLVAIQGMIPPATSEGEASPAKAEPNPGDSRVVLVVEDNPDNLLTVRAALAEVDCTIVTAGDGQQAVETAARERPGLIIMDLMLPVMSGLDATRRIKSDPELAQIPIIALTAGAMKGDREGALEAGCNDYLSKPFDPKDLQAVVRYWFGEHEGEGRNE